MIKAQYFYNLYTINQGAYEPFAKCSLIGFLMDWLDLIDEGDLAGYQLPSDLGTNEDIYDELISLVLSKYHTHANIKIEKYVNEGEPTNEEKAAAVKEWAYKFIALLNDTHDYYITLLTNYAAAKSHLMDDIRATSENKVGFNDTPQNPNSAQVYEGDDYLTHFTKTSGSTSSPLMSKIMRLKEIQDNFRDLMSEWVRDFGRIFYEEEC